MKKCTKMFRHFTLGLSVMILAGSAQAVWASVCSLSQIRPELVIVAGSEARDRVAKAMGEKLGKFEPMVLGDNGWQTRNISSLCPGVLIVHMHGLIPAEVKKRTTEIDEPAEVNLVIGLAQFAHDNPNAAIIVYSSSFTPKNAKAPVENGMNLFDVVVSRMADPENHYHDLIHNRLKYIYWPLRHPDDHYQKLDTMISLEQQRLKKEISRPPPLVAAGSAASSSGAGQSSDNSPNDEKEREGNSILTIILGALAIFGFGFGVVRTVIALNRGYQDRKTLEAAYPQLEKLVAVYSLVAYKAHNQDAPLVTQDSSFGDSHQVQLAVSDPKWERSEFVPGLLLDAMAATRHMHSYADEIEAMNVPTNQDWRSKFTWEALFSYELQVTINPKATSYPGLYHLKDTVSSASKMIGQQVETDWEPKIYAILLEGLPSEEEVQFLCASGYFEPVQSGDFNIHNEWVVYLDNDAPLRVGAINKLIQKALERQGIKQTRIEQGWKEFQAQWNTRTGTFTKSVMDELGQMPDLVKLVDYLNKSH